MGPVAALLALVFALAAAAPAAAQSGPRNCTVLSQNMFVRDVLDEYYLWYSELPRLNPANHPTPEAYLEAARYRPLDSSFSYLTSRRANDAFFGESQFVGFGFTTQITAAGELVVLQVFPDSPASEGGLSRGDRIVTIDGRRVSELVERGGVDAALGADQPGIASTLVFRTRDGQQRRATLTKRVVTIPTVSLTRTFDVDGRRVGYVFFRNFVRPSYAALDEAFAALAEAGVTELVLDLRYNGGGLVDVAVHLGGLVGGSLTEGQIFASFRHNDRNRALDEDLRFGSAPPQSLRLSRVVVIATRSSASASELFINSLRPYLPVIVIGDATYGKPVGHYGFTFCDKVVAPVSFRLLNAHGEGDYFDGIRPDCRAADDVERDLGEGDEASLAEALHFIRTGRCSEATTLRARRATPPKERAYGWQALVNAW